MNKTVNAGMIRRALNETYRTPEWYLGFEVGNSTGADCKRHADAVAINAYPSKGFETRGFEIKVSKQDLVAELKNGIKSDEIARFCDYWFLVTPKGLTEGATLPPTWGIIEYHDGKLRQTQKAEKLKKVDATPGFICAMLRGRERVTAEAAGKITAEREEEIIRQAMWRAGDAERELKKLHEKLEEIRESTGIKLDDWTPTQSIIHRLQAAQSLDIITRNIRVIERGAKDLVEDVKEIEQAVAAMRDGEEVKE